MKNKNRLILLAIVIAGFVLRVIYLDKYPPSPNWDEVSHGYNAYSILQTGKDEWGNLLPLIFRAYGDYKLPVYIYTTAVSVFAFGLNELAVRLPSALAGVATVVFTYHLVIELFRKSKKLTGLVSFRWIALFAAMLVAIEPWSLFLSRGAFEANLALMFFVGGIYFLISGLRKPKHFLISSLLLGLTVWTYNSYRIFTPLMLGVFFVVYRSQIINLWKKNRRVLLYSLIVAAIFFIPMFIQLSAEVGQARYSKVSIINEGAVNEINEQRASVNYHPILERVLYNKGSYFLSAVVVNWASHYMPDFLFINGGDQYQFSVQNHGLLHLINFPFLLIGVVLLVIAARKKKKSALFLLLWFLIAPLPASITRESPHVLRTITMLPIPMILASYGFFGALSVKGFKKTNIKLSFTLLYFVVLLVFFGSYLRQYVNDYRKDYSWSWQYGYKQVVEYTKNVYEDYDKIIVTKKYGEPHIFYLFYWPWESDSYMNDKNLIRFEQSDWYWVDRFDKFYFVNDWEIPTKSDEDFVLESGEEFNCHSSKCLLVTSPGTHQLGWELLKTIYFLDGKPAFEILEN